ncbi:MAG: alpha/beta hydrolase [Leptolyngbyaceae bacterium]|nr:alpha/beta hydrolase [Leptolyngbyaceae bacterium]
MVLSSMIKPVLCGSAIGVASAIGFVAPAVAADLIELTYQSTTVTISTDEIKDFAATGAVPTDLQTFFDETAQVPENIRTLLTNVIRIPKFVESFLDSPTGEFVLLQLDQTISSSGSTDLESLQTAFSSAGSDRDISVLEMLEAFPESEVRLNLTDLEGTYNRVNNFIVNVQPAIDTAIGFLQDIVCECETGVVGEVGEPMMEESMDMDEPMMEEGMDMDEPMMEEGMDMDEPMEEVQSIHSADTITAAAQTTNCQTSQLTEGLLDIRPVIQETASATDAI